MALRTVIDANVRWSRATERRLRLPTDKTLWQQFEQDADALLRGLPDGATVLDPAVAAGAFTRGRFSRPGASI